MPSFEASIEYQVLKRSALHGDALSPSVRQMQEWLNNKVSHRHNSRASEDVPSPQEFEERMHRVWGTNTTPAMQTLECIQKVKAALSQQEEEDSMSSATFGILVAASLVVVLGIVVVWELFLRPR